MKIYYQTNNNDCGIAVTQSLINYFFKKTISKEELYRESNLREDGLSILDFEILNSKYGVHLESYSMSFDEFKEYKSKDYFVLVINRDGFHHYTIAKKSAKEKIILFDPAFGKSTVYIHDLKDMWLGLFITVSKKVNYSKQKFTNSILQDKLDIFQIFILFCISSFTLLFSIINTYLIKYIFDRVHQQQDFLNLFKLILASIVFFGVFYFGEFLESWMSFRNRIRYSIDLHKKLMNSLHTKKNSYFQKLGKNQFLLLKDHIDCIASYHSEYVNKFVLGVFILCVSSIFLFFKSPYFLLLITLFATIQWIFWRISKDQYHIFFPILNRLQSLGKRVLNDLESFLQKEHNSLKLNHLSNYCSNNFIEEAVHQKKLFLLQSFYGKLNSLINHLVYLCIFVWISYCIFFQNLNFGHLIIMNIFYSHINKSFSSILGYYQFKPRYDYSKQIYSQLLNIDSFKEEKNESLPIPKQIFIRNLFYSSCGKVIFRDLNLSFQTHTLIVGPSGSGKSMLYKLMIRKINPSNSSIYFDERDISTIDPGQFRDLCIYQISNSYIHDPTVIAKSIDNLPKEIKEKILMICDLMNFDPFQSMNSISDDRLSSGQKQLLNICFLLNLRNKVLFLDEIASNINSEARIEIYKYVIPFLAKENFVLCTEHSPEIIPLFPNVVDICRN